MNDRLNIQKHNMHHYPPQKNPSVQTNIEMAYSLGFKDRFY